MNPKTKILKKMKQQIDELDEDCHIEILDILIKNNIDITIKKKNQSVMTNLKFINDDILLKIQTYIDFVIKQQKEMEKFDKEVKNVKESFFS